MEITTITDVLGNFAFPIAIVAILLFFLAKILKAYKDSLEAQKTEIKEVNRQYHEDYKVISEAINNNTNAVITMNKLVEHLLESKK